LTWFAAAREGKEEEDLLTKRKELIPKEGGGVFLKTERGTSQPPRKEERLIPGKEKISSYPGREAITLLFEEEGAGVALKMKRKKRGTHLFLA